MSSPTNPSWNWLPPRPSTRELADRGRAPAAPDARPCLPAIEPLDDRILLSVASPELATKQQPTANTGILIGLLKGQLDLIKGEISDIKLAGGGETQVKGESVIKLLTNQFLKLDETFLKLGDALVVGDADGYKYHTIKLNEVLHKIDNLLPSESSVLPAVQQLLKDLRSTETVGQVVEHKEQKLLLKLSDSFLKIDEALLKFAADPTGAQYKEGQNPTIKITQEFLKIDALLQQLDPQIKGELTEALNTIKIGTLDYLGSLTKPPVIIGDGGLSTHGQFDGGVILPEDTGGDILA